MSWISVENSLPVFWKDVLVFDENGYIFVAKHVRNNWTASSCYSDCCGCKLNVTHWQPLPEIPEEY